LPIKRAIAKTNFTIQPLAVTASTPAIGSLPAISTSQPAVPTVTAQGDSYFSRNSIGSSFLDTKLDIPLFDNSEKNLSKSSADIVKNIGLSPERFSIIAATKIKDNEDTLDKLLQIIQFEEALLNEDYLFIKNYLSQDTNLSSITKPLEDKANLDDQSVQNQLQLVAKLSNAVEGFSQALDFKRFAASNEIKNKITSQYNVLPKRLVYNSEVIDFLKEKNTISTSDLSNIVGNISKVDDIYYNQIYDYVSLNGLVAGAFNSLRDNNSNLTHEMQISILCELISRTFSETFSGKSLKNTNIVSVYSGSNVFESQNLENDKIYLSSGYEKSHRQGIITPALTELDSSKISNFEKAVLQPLKDIVETSAEFSSIKSEDENGSGFDIYQRILGYACKSFSTALSDIEGLNQNEIIDPVLLRYSLYSGISCRYEKLADFIRGLILTILLDEDYNFNISGDIKNYEVVSKTKAEITDDTGTYNVSSKVGSNTSYNASLEENGENYQQIFGNESRKKNFTSKGLEYARNVFIDIDSGKETRFTLDRPFGIANNASDEDSWSNNAPKNGDDSDYVQYKNFLPIVVITSISDGSKIIQGNPFIERLENLKGSNGGSTVITSIKNVYDEIVSVFESTSGKTAKEILIDDNFVLDGKVINKRVIFDAIIECFAILSEKIRVGFSTFVTNQSTTSGGVTTTNKVIRFLSLSNDSQKMISLLKAASETKNIKNLYSTERQMGFLSYLSDSIAFSYKMHNNSKSAYASSIAIVNEIYKKSADFQSALDNAKKEIALNDQTKQFLKILTPETVSNAIQYYNEKFSIWDTSTCISSVDISAVNWLKKNSTGNIVIFGLPAECYDSLRRQTEMTLLKRFLIDENGAKKNNVEPSKFIQFYFDERKINDSFTFQTGSLSAINTFAEDFAIYHAFVNAELLSEIAIDQTITDVSKSSSIQLSCYDNESGKWIKTSYDECLNFLAVGGTFKSSVFWFKLEKMKKVINSHVMSAILKSSIRTLSGINFSTSRMQINDCKLSSSRASSLLQILNAIPSNLIPRGGLSAEQFLSKNTDGTFSPVPYSQLSGEAPNLITPSDYSLLVKFIKSGIFTSDEMIKSILSPTIFERMYAFQVMLEQEEKPDLLLYASRIENLNVEEI
jgi:hypothetical protein